MSVRQAIAKVVSAVLEGKNLSTTRVFEDLRVEGPGGIWTVNGKMHTTRRIE